MSKRKGRQKTNERAAEASPPEPGRRVWLLVALFVLLTVVAYLPSLEAPFYFDDHRNIVHNPLLRDLSWFARPWTVDSSGADSFHIHAFKTRFVSALSLAINYRIGGLAPLGFHLTNLGLHLVSALLVGLGVRRALLLPAFEGSRVRARAVTAAVVVAGLFALHPIQTQAVTYVVQRAAVLAGLFCLLSFWAYLRAVVAAGRAQLGFGALSFLALGAACLSKQSAFAFPLLLALFDSLFVPRSRRARLGWLAAPILAAIIVPLLQLYLVLRSMGSSDLLGRATTLSGEVSRLDYFSTQLRMLVRYLGLLVWPRGLTLEHDVRLSSSLLEPTVLASALLLSLVAALGAWWILRAWRRDSAWRLAGFGLFWFFVAQAVESSLIPIPDLMVEHRLYLPSVGFLLAVVLTALLLLGASARRGQLLLCLGVTVALAGATFLRNLTWSDERTFWLDALGKSPNRVRVVYNAGFAELQAGRLDHAEQLLLRAVTLDPGYSSAWIWLGHLARKTGRSELAVHQYERAIAASPSNWRLLLDLRAVRIERGEMDEADRLWREAVRLAGSEAAVAAADRPPP